MASKVPSLDENGLQRLNQFFLSAWLVEQGADAKRSKLVCLPFLQMSTGNDASGLGRQVFEYLPKSAAIHGRHVYVGNHRAQFRLFLHHLHYCVRAIRSDHNLKVQRREHGARDLAYIGLVIHHEDGLAVATKERPGFER